MWFVFALLAAIMAALSVTFTKAGVENLDSTLVFAIEAVLILLISWSTVLVQQSASEISKIDKRTWLFILGAGVATTLASIFQFKALKLGEHVPAVSSIDRSSIIFTVFLAAIFLKEKITWQSLVGAALIIAGAIFISVGREGAK